MIIVVFDLLAPIFRSRLIHGTVTISLLACAFLPLFKGGLKDPAKTDSYRAIAGASLLLKLFDNVVLLLWGDLLGSDSLQFGFKRNTSTTQCSWMVMEVARYFLNRGSPCIVTLMDCSKAGYFMLALCECVLGWRVFFCEACYMIFF